MSTETKIVPKDDGPLLVMAPPRLRQQDGAQIDTKDVVALCRCGASQNKPFCDGAHVAAGFSSAPDHSAIRNEPITYAADVDGCSVTVTYTPVLCSHAAECQRLAAGVFNPAETPWVKPENGTITNILAVMSACPSGALRVSVGDQQTPQHLTTGDVEIVIEKDGPYRVTNVPIEAEYNGAGASRAKYVLCRCGQSKNKPFCDGTHHDVQWRDDR